MFLHFLIFLLFFLLASQAYTIFNRIKSETIYYIEFYQKLENSNFSRKMFFKVLKGLILKRQLTYGRNYDKLSYEFFRIYFIQGILEIIFFYAVLQWVTYTSGHGQNARHGLCHLAWTRLGRLRGRESR